MLVQLGQDIRDAEPRPPIEQDLHLLMRQGVLPQFAADGAGGVDIGRLAPLGEGDLHGMRANVRLLDRLVPLQQVVRQRSIILLPVGHGHFLPSLALQVFQKRLVLFPLPLLLRDASALQGALLEEIQISPTDAFSPLLRELRSGGGADEALVLEGQADHAVLLTQQRLVVDGTVGLDHVLHTRLGQQRQKGGVRNGPVPGLVALSSLHHAADLFDLFLQLRPLLLGDLHVSAQQSIHVPGVPDIILGGGPLLRCGGLILAHGNGVILFRYIAEGFLPVSLQKAGLEVLKPLVLSRLTEGQLVSGAGGGAALFRLPHDFPQAAPHIVLGIDHILPAGAELLFYKAV